MHYDSYLRWVIVFFTSVYENAIFASFALATDNKKELTSWKRLTTGKNEKEYFWHGPCHEIYRDEAVGLKSCKYAWKIMIYVNMWNLGQFHEKIDILSIAA